MPRALIANEWVEADAERAVVAAVRGFETTRLLPSWRRAEILRKTAEGLGRRKDELARTITEENAKPIRLSRAEVDRAALTFTAAAEEAKRIGGEVLPLDLTPSSEGRVGLVRRLPLGPVLGIAPFNFPLNLVAHKVAPAIAAGNTIVLKPSSATPRIALLLGEILLEAGMTPGMANILPCPAATAERLAADDRFKLLTFTGSPAVGWALKAKAGRKRVALELGGNAAVIVHEDADLALAAERCAAGGFAYAGQVCISVQRVYLHEGIAGDFTARLLERTSKLVVGDPFDEKTDLGPMIDDAAAARAEAWIEEAVAGGAQRLCGGRRNGRVLPPTILEGVPRSSKLHAEEAFAPVVNLYRYRDYDEALREVNASAYGLQAGVFTRDVGRLLRAQRDLELGAVIANDVPSWRLDTMPYGGEKESGLGREGVKYAVEEMTRPSLLALGC